MTCPECDSDMEYYAGKWECETCLSAQIEKTRSEVPTHRPGQIIQLEGCQTKLYALTSDGRVFYLDRSWEHQGWREVPPLPTRSSQERDGGS